MKYHASFSTIIISLIVLLVFAAAAVFTVSNLSMTSPTLIITEMLLEEIAAADSDLSLSFGSIDRSFRDGITIRDIEVSYKDEDIASFQTLRIHMGLFSLIKYLASSDGNLAIEGYDGCINIPDALALSRGDGGSSALLDVISRYAFSIHLHDFSISLPHGISAENAELSLYISEGLGNISCTFSSSSVEAVTERGTLRISDPMVEAAIGSDIRIALLFPGISIEGSGISATVLDGRGDIRLTEDFEITEARASLGSVSFSYDDISMGLQSLSLSYLPQMLTAVLIDGSGSYGRGDFSFGRMDLVLRDASSADVYIDSLSVRDSAAEAGSDAVYIHLDAGAKSVSLSSDEMNLSVPDKASLMLGSVDASVTSNDGNYGITFASSVEADADDVIIDNSYGNVLVNAEISGKELRSFSADISDFHLPFIDGTGRLAFSAEDGTYAFSIRYGSVLNGEGSYDDGLYLNLSVNDFRLKQLRPVAEAYLPAISRYIGDDTVLTGFVSADLDAGEVIEGPVSLALAVSDISFGDFSFSAGAYTIAEFTGNRLVVSDLSLTTDWGRASWTGSIDLERMLPDGRFIISSTNSGEHLFEASLALSEDDTYSFSAYLPSFYGSRITGSVDFSDERIVKADADFIVADTLYPFTVSADKKEKHIDISNDALNIALSYGQRIEGSAVFDEFALPVPSSDVAPCVLSGTISAGFDFASQTLSISIPSFQIVNMRYLPTSPDLSFSAEGDNNGIIFSDIILAGIDTEPLRGTLNLGFGENRYALYLTSSTEELMGSAVLSGDSFTGIFRLDDFDMARFGIYNYRGDVNLTGNGGTLSDIGLSGTIALESKDMANNPGNINAMMYVDSGTFELRDLTFIRKDLTVYSPNIAFVSEDGLLSASLDISYGDEADISFGMNFNLPEGSSIFDSISSFIASGFELSGNIVLESLDADGRFHAGQRTSSFTYSGGFAEFTGDFISGTADAVSRAFSLQFDFSPIAKFRAYGSLDTGRYGLDVDMLEISVINMMIRRPNVVFYEPSVVSGRLWLEREARDWNLSGYLSAETAALSLFWMPDQMIVIHNPTFTVWDNTLTSNITDCSVVFLDDYRRVPVRARLTADFDRTLAFESYSIEAFVDEGREVFVRVPMVEANIDMNGYASGHFVFSSDIVNADFSGEVSIENAMMSVGMAPLPDWWEEDDINATASFDVVLKEDVSFVFPLRVNPILTANMDENQRIQIQYSKRDGLNLSGNLDIRSGEFYYFQKNFYITEGNIGFQQTESGFDPLINLRARLRDFDSNGESVDIYLVLRNSTLSDLRPTFESSPVKDINEIMTILGSAILPSTAYGNISATSVASLVTASMDLLSTFGVIDSQSMGLEQTVRSALNLDTFSLHSNIVQNIFLDTVSFVSSSMDDNLTPMARYLNGTSIYMGKYLVPQLYLEAMIHLTANADSTDEKSTFIADDLNLDIEFSLEWETPMCTFRFFTEPSNFTFYDFIDSFGFGFMKRIVW